MPTWSRDAQDAAEAEHPPPKEPQEDPKVRMWSIGRLVLLLAAVAVAFVLLARNVEFF